MTITEQECKAATERAAQQRRDGPVAVRARFDRRRMRVVVSLASGLEIAFRPEDAQGLEGASAEQLSQIEISPSGQGLHFPLLDADLFLPALLEGHFGSKRWMAAQIGRTGGARSSEAKARAARENGRLGGRPRKQA